MTLLWSGNFFSLRINSWVFLFVVTIFAPIASSSSVAIKPTVIVNQACQKISNKLASVDYQACRSFGLQIDQFSTQGFPILLKEYPPLKNKPPRGRVLLVGGMHGDELSSISIVFKWMKTLDKHHSGLFHWQIAPLLNPDGALRKKHNRLNANHVDLNRNFPIPQSHSTAALDYWKNRTSYNKRRYPGPYPLSERETQWLFNKIKQFKPDIIISVHAPYSLVDYDAPNRKNAPKRIGYLYKNLMGTYPGSLGNYAGIHLGIPVITLELPHAGIMPTKTHIGRLWVDLVRWLIRNVQTGK